MASCEQVRERMQEILEHGSAPRRRDASDLDAHLEHARSCVPCRAEMARWSALLASLEELPEADVPADFADSVMADLPEMLPAAEGAGHVLRWGVLVAALLSGFVASMALIVNEGGPETARQTLQPLGASLQLGGILLAQAAAALALAIAAMSETASSMSAGSRALAVAVFAALNAGLLALLTTLRPREAHGTSRRRR